MTEVGAEADVAEAEEVTEAGVEAAEGKASFELLALDLHAYLCTRLHLRAGLGYKTTLWLCTYVKTFRGSTHSLGARAIVLQY